MTEKTQGLDAQIEDIRRERTAAAAEALAQAEEKARRLIDEGWYQTSNRHRMLARLPQGMTGQQALAAAVVAQYERIEAPPELIEDRVLWAARMSEGHAGDHYLRCCAPPEDQLTIPFEEREVFFAFKRLAGWGATYLGRHGGRPTVSTYDSPADLQPGDAVRVQAVEKVCGGAHHVKLTRELETCSSTAPCKMRADETVIVLRADFEAPARCALFAPDGFVCLVDFCPWCGRKALP